MHFMTHDHDESDVVARTLNVIQKSKLNQYLKQRVVLAVVIKKINPFLANKQRFTSIQSLSLYHLIWPLYIFYFNLESFPQIPGPTLGSQALKAQGYLKDIILYFWVICNCSLLNL